MTPFSALLEAVRAAGGTYLARIPEDWLQGRTSFGGLTAALCVAAVERALPDLPPLRSAQFTFVAPAGGAIEMTPRLLRRGKSSVFAAVELRAHGALATHATLSFCAARESKYSYRLRAMPKTPSPGTTEAFFRSGKPKFTQ